MSWRSTNTITSEQSASWYAAKGATGEHPEEPPCLYCDGIGCPDCLEPYDDTDRDRLDDR